MGLDQAPYADATRIGSTDGSEVDDRRHRLRDDLFDRGVYGPRWPTDYPQRPGPAAAAAVGRAEQLGATGLINDLQQDVALRYVCAAVAAFWN